MTILFVLLAILLLGLLIVAHELGHFLSARMLKISVKEFSVGFGPKLWQRQSKKTDTLYSLRAVPFGGYCAYFDEDADTLDKSDPRRFTAAPAWKRMIVVVAGAAMNILLAFVLAIALHLFYGMVPAQPSILEVVPGSPAAEAGILPGDVLLEVDGEAVESGDAGKLTDVINASDNCKGVIVTLSRGDGEHTLTVTPQYDEAEDRRLIGVSVIAYTRPNVLEAIEGAWDSSVYASTVIVQSLGRLIFRGEGAEDVVGPVGTVQVIAEQVQTGGFYMFLSLAVLISINLGLFNLLPIPGLDGSRFLFLLAEAIRRRPVNRKLEGTIHMIGFALLIGLLLLFTFRDVRRIFGG